MLEASKPELRFRSINIQVRETLHDQARKAAKMVGLTCRIGDGAMAGTVDALMGEFSFRVDEPGETRTTGSLQFILRAREARDQQRAVVTANRLKELMEHQKWEVAGSGRIETGAMRVQVLKGFKVGRGVTVVSGGFDICDLNYSTAI